MRPNPKLIETRFKEGLERWVQSACQPGHFLSAVLANDLKKAVMYGDDAALDNLVHIVSYIYNELPCNCWGSEQKMDNWAKLKENDDGE